MEKYKIVAVDDAPFVCETLESWLSVKYDIKTFLSGKEALNYLKDTPVDLILLDYDMPELTGYEVLMGIRGVNNVNHNKPVVFLTAVTNERMEVEMLERGANDYIRKPLDMTLLKDTISKYLK